ncbi:DUF5667 domain-containing protein [Nocardioides sp. C4-1]|uniref:DUF5667 domain-containing protein n=1 Tax=Nocardioides sp. C4-1 TaxID=3151851 RepID=UPI0032660440
MNPVFPARRRADEFNAMVEDASTVPLADAESARVAELTALVDVVTALRAAPPAEARPEFVSDLRSRLVLAAETTLVPDPPARLEVRRQAQSRRTSRERRLAVAIGGFALVSASASMSVAAQSALPGDTLYPLKRGLENVHERVVRDPDDRGATMLANAEGRLDEVDSLSRAGDGDAEVIAQTLEDFSDQAVEASTVLLDDYADTGRVRPIEDLRAFTAQSIGTLRRLEAVVPVDARGTLISAARIIDGIDAEALLACPACGDALPVGPLETAGDLGPILDLLPPPGKPAPATPAAPAPTPRAEAPQTPAPAGQPAPVPVEPVVPAPVEEPATPVLPQPSTPQAPSGDGTPRNPLQVPLAGLQSPVEELGDLLTGAVDETVGGLQGLLGGQPKN